MIVPRNKQQGVGVVEIVVVSGIASLVFAGILQLVVLTNRPVEAGIRKAEATYLAEEGIEAVKALRNEGWSTNITSLSNGTTYYPTIVSSAWTLSTTDPGIINNIYARTVVLEAVYRDGNDDIASSGTLDPKTRKITSTVTWNEHGATESVVLETYITNFRDS